MTLIEQIDFIYKKYIEVLNMPATSEGLVEAKAYLRVLKSLETMAKERGIAVTKVEFLGHWAYEPYQLD